MIRAFHDLSPGEEFVDNWHIDAIVAHLEAVKAHNIKRLIINIPPRHLKSFIVSVCFPAWILGHSPSSKIMVASYSQRLSFKHSSDTRNIMASPWYRGLFPETTLSKSDNQKQKFCTVQHGFRFASSIGGTLTGEGGDVLIVDDPQTPLQAGSEASRAKVIEWFDHSFSTRLNDKKNGAIVVVMQRLHTDDLTGHLLKKGCWHLLNLPSVCEEDTEISCGQFHYHRKKGEFLIPSREGKKEIDLIKKEIGSYAFSAQYQQNPVPSEGSIIRAIWLQYHSPMEDFATDDALIYQSWDTAAKAQEHNDYSVCTTWAVKSGKYHLIDLFRERLEYPELRQAISSCYSKHLPSAVLIEDKGTGQVLVQEIARTIGEVPVIPNQPLTRQGVSLFTCL